jgi:hypothetical protein
MPTDIFSRPNFAAKIRARPKAYIAQPENGTNIAQKAGTKQMTAASL